LSLRLLALSAGCVVLLAGCGDDPAPTTASTPTATATAMPTATATPTPTATPTATATATATGGGDEGSDRTLVKLTLGVEDVDPAEITVPAFLGVEFEVSNRSGSERIVRFADKVIVELLPGDTERGVIDGLQPGEHFLDAGESGRVKVTARPGA
jgi:hypothetical protein